MTDWKTTVPGIIAAFCAFVAFSASALDWPQWLVLLSGFAAAGGLAALGVNAKQIGPIKIVIALLLIGVMTVQAQTVRVKITPEPMGVPAAVLPNAKDMGRSTVEVCNLGAVPRTLYWEEVSQASTTRFIDAGDATLVLAGHQRRTKLGTMGAIGKGATVAVGIGLSVFTRNPNSSLTALRVIGALTTAQQVIPQVVTYIQGEAPQAGPLLSTLKWPITLAPSGSPQNACLTDHVWAAKVSRSALKPEQFIVGGSIESPPIRAVIEAVPQGGAAGEVAVGK